MNRQALIAQESKKILALDSDTAEKTKSANGVSEVTIMLAPAAYARWEAEVVAVAVAHHKDKKTRGFRALHNDLREGALRILQEEIDAATGNKSVEVMS